MTKKTISIISLMIFLVSFPSFLQAAERFHLRDERYCEILLAQTPTQFAVYNTIGLNDCPEDLWKHITPTALKKQTQAKWVHLNGPRYWVIDGLENSTLINPNIKRFQGLAMREAGIVHLRLLDLIFHRAYEPHQVERHTIWIYEANKPVYELIDKQGQVYVMQSYSVQQVKQTKHSLQQLGSILDLPKGWSFKSGVLKQQEKLPTENNIAIVLQDNFLNTYQKSTHDFLSNKGL